MHSTERRSSLQHPCVLFAAIVGGWLSLVPVGHALAVTSQPLPSDPQEAHVAPTQFDGRDFATLDLPSPPQKHALTLSAAQAFTWIDRSTNRVYLERDVRVSIGPYTFEARRAVVWIEPILVGDQEGDQVAVYFDGLRRSPGRIDNAISFTNEGAGATIESSRLLVTAVLFGHPTRLRADVFEQRRPENELISAAESRLARFLTELDQRNQPDSQGSHELPQSDPEPAQNPDSAPPKTGEPDSSPSLPSPGGAEPADQPEPSSAAASQPSQGSTSDDANAGLVYFSGEQIELVTEGLAGERAAVVTGGVVVQYVPPPPERPVQLSAQRAVLFLGSAADAAAFRYRSQDVGGVYLEGDVVASSGDYTLRGKRVFYDVKTNRAVLLDAVFWTFDEERGMPLYVRADVIRQEASNEWTGRNVRLANVGFAEPHFSVGATDVTLQRLEQKDLPDRMYVDARGAGFRVGDLPLITVPRVRGEFKPSPLRRLDFASEAGSPVIRSAWDLHTILGTDPPPGNEATLLLDGYLERGPAVGSELKWQNEDLTGLLFGYYVHDDGTDRFPDGEEIDRDNDDRGLILAEQKWTLDPQWTLSLEGSYISDEAFLTTFFEQEAKTRREIISSAHLRRLDDRSLLSAELRATFNDFVANEYLLQSLGYVTEKLPEFTYTRVADPLFGGALNYSSEYQYTRAQLSFSEVNLRDQGFKKVRQAREGFGLLPGDSIGDSLRAQGLTEDSINRFDTRHEFEAPLVAGPVNVAPFVVGRATVYDENFDQFNGNSDQDDYRFWGAAGARASTSLVRIDDSVRNEMLDLNRMRHIIEPNATVWFADSSIDQQDLPIYDDDVESLADGLAVRAGIRSTWQTMRGPQDRQRSVDWLVINTDLVWSSSDVDRESPYGRFIEARPELSNLGRFVNTDAIMQLTDAVALTSGILVDTDDGQLSRLIFGSLFDHGQGFKSFLEFRQIDVPDATLFTLGARYEFTRKYAMDVGTTWDIENEKFQSFGVAIQRRFPQWTVDFIIDVDEIAEDVSFGVSLKPVGFAGENRRRIYTRDDESGDLLRTTASPVRGRISYGPFGESLE